MPVSKLALFIFCAILMTVIYFIVARAVKKNTGTPLRKRWIFAFCCFGFILWGLMGGTIIPQVITIDGSDDNYTHTKELHLFSYTDDYGVKHPLSVGCSYIENLTDEELIIYPVVYGEVTSSSPGRKNCEYIKAQSFKKVRHTPGHFFSRAPYHIYMKESEKTKTEWYLDLRKNIYFTY